VGWLWSIIQIPIKTSIGYKTSLNSICPKDNKLLPCQYMLNTTWISWKLINWWNILWSKNRLSTTLVIVWCHIYVHYGHLPQTICTHIKLEIVGWFATSICIFEDMVDVGLCVYMEFGYVIWLEKYQRWSVGREIMKKFWIC
jgi:hypothetical protein